MPPKTSPREKLLTPVELELMGVLWRLGGATVNEVLGQLPRERKLAYTSVSTMLRILEQKRYVVSRKDGRGHRYEPALPKEQYEATTLRHVVAKVFDGTPSSLVSRLLDDTSLSKADLDAIREVLREKLGDE